MASPLKPFLTSRPKIPPLPVDFGDRSVHRLHFNECPFPPSPAVTQAIAEAAGRLNHYPDAVWSDLTHAIATEWDWPQDRIICANGSDELLMMTGQLVLGPGDEAVAPGPCFANYPKSAAAQGATLIQVPVRHDGGIDIDATLAAITPRTKLVFVTTPMNPTGTLMQTAEFTRLAREIPDHALLVLDEAYYEFGRFEGGGDHLPALRDRSGPWIVLRTFSKAYALAGLRLGYALCGSEEVRTAFDQVRIGFNVNRLSQAGAAAALTDPGHTAMILENNKRERERMAGALTALWCRVLDSATNFIAAELPCASPTVVSALRAEADIWTQAIAYPGFENFIRISVGGPEDTDALLAAFPGILQRALDAREPAE
ncbi:pyridoxal phosphate-dependent aminotransferase [Hwanghaeella grinnelliae]|nr:histidinol-phosphate transaminase [Hwanghaeella grinnelliae]